MKGLKNMHNNQILENDKVVCGYCGEIINKSDIATNDPYYLFVCNNCVKEFNGEDDKSSNIMKCTVCGQECYDETYPEVVFKDEKYCVCEECSIDYEEVNSKVQYRQDLLEEGCIERFYNET